MTCRTPVSIVCGATLAALVGCGSDAAGDELPDGAFTTGPGMSSEGGDDDPTLTDSMTDPSGASDSDDASSTSSTSATSSSSSSESTDAVTVDDSSTTVVDPTTETTAGSTSTPDPTTETTIDPTTETTFDPTTETTFDPTIDPTIDPTDETTTETGPVETCGDGEPDIGEICLQPPVAYAMGLSPADVVLGDFDGDGDLDVATANLDDDTVSVRLGNGDGTFADEATYATGSEPVALEVGRFDAGTDDDIVVVNRGSNDVSILLADGDGGFLPATTEAVGTTPVDVGVASVDNAVDDDDDIVVLNQADGEYTVLLSEGDGTFTSSGAFATTVATQNTLVVQSYNSLQDTNTDVFVLGGTDYIGLPGDGSGGTLMGIAMGAIAQADIVRASTFRIDGGATWDIAVVEDMNDRVLFLMGDGNAGFQQFGAGVNTDPSDVVAIDVDGDDIRDAVVAHRGADSVGIVPFAGAAFDDPLEFPAGMGPSAIKAADLDGDSVADIVTSNAAGDDITVLLSDP